MKLLFNKALQEHRFFVPYIDHQWFIEEDFMGDVPSPKLIDVIYEFRKRMKTSREDIPNFKVFLNVVAEGVRTGLLSCTEENLDAILQEGRIGEDVTLGDYIKATPLSFFDFNIHNEDYPISDRTYIKAHTSHVRYIMDNDLDFLGEVVVYPKNHFDSFEIDELEHHLLELSVELGVRLSQDDRSSVIGIILYYIIRDLYYCFMEVLDTICAGAFYKKINCFKGINKIECTERGAFVVMGNAANAISKDNVFFKRKHLLSFKRRFV